MPDGRVVGLGMDGGDGIYQVYISRFEDIRL